MIDNCKIIGNWQLLIANCFNFATINTNCRLPILFLSELSIVNCQLSIKKDRSFPRNVRSFHDRARIVGKPRTRTGGRDHHFDRYQRHETNLFLTGETAGGDPRALQGRTARTGHVVRLPDGRFRPTNECRVYPARYSYGE